jgi:cytochrome c-type biogenesis protein CcmH/NrfF
VVPHLCEDREVRKVGEEVWYNPLSAVLYLLLWFLLVLLLYRLLIG